MFYLLLYKNFIHNNYVKFPYIYVCKIRNVVEIKRGVFKLQRYDKKGPYIQVFCLSSLFVTLRLAENS